MFNPLVGSLSGLTHEELYSKYNDLQKRLNQAYKSGPSSAIPQLMTLLEHYQTELSERSRKQMEEMAQRSEQSGKGYKGIIDIS